jgi:putative acetyltransferase
MIGLSAYYRIEQRKRKTAMSFGVQSMSVENEHWYYGTATRKEIVLINIREERPEDIVAIRRVNIEAFGRPHEANLIESLRANAGILLSLVATLGDEVVGHILYSAVIEGSGKKKIAGAGLGPIAVLPTYQRRGVGTKLIEFGTMRLKESGCPFVVVLGHTAYYPRFGFRPARDYGLKCEWSVPDNAFMALVLDESKIRELPGSVKYRQEFASVV